MISRQDGQGVAPYAAETAREIGNLGAGGHGNFENLGDAVDRGVTPGLVAETEVRGVEQTEREAAGAPPGGAEPSTGEQHSSPGDLSTPSETEPAGKTMPDNTQKIREKAHELWILEGRPHGRDLVHWEMARELVAQEENIDTTLLPIEPPEDGVEDAVAALDNEGEAPGLTDQGKDDSDALRVAAPMETPASAKKKAGRVKV